MQSIPPAFDDVMDQILFVTHDVATVPDSTQRAQKALSVSLVFSGVRCILQYLVLPFILPLIGVAADATIPILLVVTAVAIVSILFSLRRLWRVRYEHRWLYLALAVVALSLLMLFFWLDMRTLLA